jgi:hypothetical protein
MKIVPALMAAALIFGLLLNPALHAQEDPVREYLTDEAPADGLEAPEDTVFLLPDVIVILDDPEYEDVETLLLGSGTQSAAFMILPELGDLTSSEAVIAEAQEAVRGAEDESAYRPLNLIVYVGGGYAPSVVLGADMRLDLAGGGEIRIATDNRYLSGLQFAEFLSGADGYRQLDLGLDLEYRGTGLLNFAAGEVALNDRGLQDYAPGDSLLVGTAGGEATMLLVDAGPSSSRFALHADLGAAWSFRRLRSDGKSDADAAADLMELGTGIRCSWTTDRVEISGEMDWNSWAETAGGAGADGNPLSFDGGISATYRVSDAAGFTAAWIPGWYSDGFAPAQFGLSVELEPLEPWSASLGVGRRSERGGWAQMQRAYPLHLVSFADTDGLREEYWYAETSALIALGDSFRLTGELDMRYYQRSLTVAPWNGSADVSVGGDAWYLGTDSALTWFSSGAFSAALSFSGAIIGADPRNPLREAGLSARYEGERFSADGAVVFPLTGALTLPVINAGAEWDISSRFAVTGSIRDPLAPLLEQPRTSGDPSLDPLATGGFSVEIVTILRL